MGQIVLEAWEHVLRTTEDPLRISGPLYQALNGEKGPTYREHLDRIRVNHFGDRIPRIEIVKRNIKRLGKPQRKPRLPD